MSTNWGVSLELDGRMQGEAILSVMYEEQMQLVRVDLTPDDWHKAYTALGFMAS